jgi:hypothetical protein
MRRSPVPDKNGLPLKLSRNASEMQQLSVKAFPDFSPQRTQRLGSFPLSQSESSVSSAFSVVEDLKNFHQELLGALISIRCLPLPATAR